MSVAMIENTRVIKSLSTIACYLLNYYQYTIIQWIHVIFNWWKL